MKSKRRNDLNRNKEEEKDLRGSDRRDIRLRKGGKVISEVKGGGTRGVGDGKVSE